MERIVYFQTALCYGIKPIEQPITLNHPIRPDSSYAISKTAGEQYIELSGSHWVSLRLANIYGPRNLSGPAADVLQRLTDGKACFVMDTRRDFIFVDDLVDVVVEALGGDRRGRTTTSPPARTSRSRSCSTPSTARDGHRAGRGGRGPPAARPRTPLRSCSTPRAPSGTSTGRRGVALSDGVAQAIEWYREHGIEQTYTHLKEEELRVR